MRVVFIMMIFFFSSGVALAQREKKVKSKKLTKVEASDMTREQKLVHESERKSKKNKPVAMQKKVKMAKKQDRQSRNTKSPKPRKKND